MTPHRKWWQKSKPGGCSTPYLKFTTERSQHQSRDVTSRRMVFPRHSFHVPMHWLPLVVQQNLIFIKCKIPRELFTVLYSTSYCFIPCVARKGLTNSITTGILGRSFAGNPRGIILSAVLVESIKKCTASQSLQTKLLETTCIGRDTCCSSNLETCQNKGDENEVCYTVNPSNATSTPRTESF